MALACRVHKPRKFSFVAKRIEKRIGCKVGIREKSILNAVTQYPERRSFIADRCICLCDLVHRLGIDHAAFVDLGLQCMKNSDGFGVLLLNSKTKGTSNFGLKESVIKLKRMIEVCLCLLEVLFVVFAEAAVKDDKGCILAIRKTL